MKHYVLVAIESSAPERMHDALRKRIARTLHVAHGDNVQCFRVDVGSPCPDMLTEARNVIDPAQ